MAWLPDRSLLCMHMAGVGRSGDILGISLQPRWYLANLKATSEYPCNHIAKRHRTGSQYKASSEWW